MQKTLTSDTLTLRPLTMSDASWLLAHWNRPAINRNSASIPSVVDDDFVISRISSANDGEEAQTDIVRLIEMDGTPVGMAGLKRPGTQHAYTLSYSLDPDSWGQGIATKATQTLLDWTDRFVSPAYYVSGHFTDNPASGRVLKKLGFLPCWRGPVFSIARDEQVDHLYMSRLI